MVAHGSNPTPPQAAEAANILSLEGRPATGAGTPSEQNRQLDLALEQAGYLLGYAIEVGIELDAGDIQRIISAIRLGPESWDRTDAGVLFVAISKLAAKLYPVTAETLRACREEAHAAIRTYRRIVYLLAIVIIPLSMASFVYTSISNSITADLNAANNLAVTLHTQLDASDKTSNQVAPPGSLSELQQFAALMRSIYSHAEQLHIFVPYVRWEPLQSKEPDTCSGQSDQKKLISATSGPLDRSSVAYSKMQLPANLKNLSADLLCVLNELTKVYQDVRLYATDLQDETSMVWGAASVSVLPVLYALLGAYAYVLRSFSKQIENRTFTPSYATLARLVVAGIGGLVVGLFNNFTFGASLSPLATAFLIGYASDIFFSFLETLMQSMRGEKTK